jgi:hypothetical protein
MTITLICRDLDTDETSIFKAPSDSMLEARAWLNNELVHKFQDLGFTTPVAVERAADFEIRCAFVGDCLELKV